MTDQDLRSQLAAMQASLRHIEANLSRADTDRQHVADKVDGVTARVVRLEARAVSPEEVHGNSIEAAVTKALRASAGQLIGYAIGLGSIAAGVVFGVLTLVIA